MSGQHVVNEVEHEGMVVQVVLDPDPWDPRDGDNLGVMFCSHRRLDLGDLQVSSEDYAAWDDIVERMKSEHGASVVLPLYVYDHSAVSISTADFGDRWDSGMVGWVCDTVQTRRLIGYEGGQQDTERQLRIEVAAYDQYLRGEMYAYVVGDVSCSGFSKASEALSEGKCAAEWLAHEQREPLGI